MYQQLTIFDIGKCCSSCSQYKPYSEYGKHSRHRDGLQSECKPCKRGRERVYRQRNGEKVRAQARRKREQPEYRKRMREYLAEWRADPTNQERQRQNMARWKQENAEYLQQYREQTADHRKRLLREWKQANRKAVAEMEHRRRDRKRSNGNQEHYERRDIFERDGWICQLCFGSVDPDATERRLMPTIDHAVRLIDGGADAPHNVQLAHWGCNSAHWSGLHKQS